VTHLKELRVPEWFIQSCQKIKYLFPKAHAAAYVSMAFRIAYFKVHYSQFLIEDGKLRIPFNKLPSLGNNVAKSIVLARKQKPFSSLEDLSKRSKLNKSHIEMFKSMVELENIPDSEQISLF